MKVGFVGLGNMGMPIAMRILGAGHEVIGCDVRESVRAGFEKGGGLWAADPAEVASRCEVVFVSLPTPAVVERVALGPQGLAGEGSRMKTYVDLSTTGPQVAKRVAAELGRRGVASLDAPVSGGIAGAAKGTLSIMVSGPKDAFETVAPVFEAFGKKPFYVGEAAGGGQLMKLINNLLSATTLAASVEALAFGMKGGLDPEVMLTVLNASTGKSGATDDKIPRYVLPGLPINFGLDLSFKDISLAVEAGEQLGVPMYIGGSIRRLWHHALNTGGPDQDMMEVAKCIDGYAGSKVYGSVPRK
jgi:3-hydroxyisobutyrate dehydrogenase-like beta-hydroxyacid dehydrogenase